MPSQALRQALPQRQLHTRAERFRQIGDTRRHTGVPRRRRTSHPSRAQPPGSGEEGGGGGLSGRQTARHPIERRCGRVHARRVRRVHHRRAAHLPPSGGVQRLQAPRCEHEGTLAFEEGPRRDARSAQHTGGESGGGPRSGGGEEIPNGEGGGQVRVFREGHGVGTVGQGVRERTG